MDWLPRRRKEESIIAIGDIHGCADELAQLLQKLSLSPDSHVVFIGDLIDRGPNSRRVIEMVMELSTFCRVTCLLGNHEDMMLRFLRNGERIDLNFIVNGGGATLASYADDSGCYEIPPEQLDFLRDRPLTYESDEFFFVHAGVPEAPLSRLDTAAEREHLLWSRSIIDSPYCWSKIVVHGHTHTKQTELLPNRINIDTGCVYGNRLSAVELPSRRVVSAPAAKNGGAAVRLLAEKGSKRRAVRFPGTVPVRVRRRDEVMVFETTNYSQVGMLMRSVEPGSQPRLQIGEVVTGTVGEGYAAVAFSGVVTRCVSNDDGDFYGTQFTAYH